MLVSKRTERYEMHLAFICAEAQASDRSRQLFVFCYEVALISSLCYSIN